MCGIGGFVGLAGEERIRAMTRALEHRGPTAGAPPDASGQEDYALRMWSLLTIELSQQRLVDEAPGQPTGAPVRVGS
jgi:glutamate synthase domain-containing protein 1